MSDGLSKWRYAKDMEFLSNVYQPKLKSNRTQNFNTTPQDNLLHSVSESTDEHDHVVTQDMVHTNIISVNDTDTFILTTYEDVTHDNDVSHEDHNMVSHSELNHDNNSMEDCVEIVKHEQHVSLDDDGNTGGEVDYEEVCLYEESGNTPSVDCETIIGAGPGTNSANSDDTKFQYIDANDFCIASMNPTRSQYSSSASSVIGAPGTIKLKSLPMVSTSTTSTSSTTLDSTASCVSMNSPSVHLQTLPELTPSPAIPPTTTSASTTASYMYATINPTRSQYNNNTNNNNNANNVMGNTTTLKLKNIPTVSSSTTTMPPTSSNSLDSTTSCAPPTSIATPSTVNLQTLPELTPSPTTPTSTEPKSDANSLLTSTNNTNNNNNQQMAPAGTATYVNTNTPSSSTTMVMSSNTTTLCNHQREECDLFFDFLKKKIQRFPPEEITSIQVEFLNCVLRREAEHAQKAQQQQQHQQQNNSLH